ncbi:hypothetical protein CDL15_Pgr011667 [Punica granatum]|uniref:Uncharacterized protein n=1 Tax=Punica granatum TaxID=22663 RepID=A0A218WY21_PUNGR|nr:hypothetical protein CDL15_Pgr011667 [Punica granatum]
MRPKLNAGPKPNVVNAGPKPDVGLKLNTVNAGPKPDVRPNHDAVNAGPEPDAVPKLKVEPKPNAVNAGPKPDVVNAGPEPDAGLKPNTRPKPNAVNAEPKPDAVNAGPEPDTGPKLKAGLKPNAINVGPKPDAGWKPKSGAEPDVVNAGPKPNVVNAGPEPGARLKPNAGPKPYAVNAGSEPDARLKPNAINACPIEKCKKCKSKGSMLRNNAERCKAEAVCTVQTGWKGTGPVGWARRERIGPGAGELGREGAAARPKQRASWASEGVGPCVQTDRVEFQAGRNGSSKLGRITSAGLDWIERAGPTQLGWTCTNKEMDRAREEENAGEDDDGRRGGFLANAGGDFHPWAPRRRRGRQRRAPPGLRRARGSVTRLGLVRDRADFRDSTRFCLNFPARYFRAQSPEIGGIEREK